MLHRTAREHDVNKDKWIGVGGHFEKGESPEECLFREVWEETGYRLTDYRFRGIVTFCTETGLCEYMCLYTAEGFEGVPTECEEGTLEWVPKEEVLNLNLWEGDKIFFYLLKEEVPFFSLKLSYQGDRLAEAVLNGKEMELFEELSEDGRGTGVVMERGVAHRDGRLHGTVHVWLIRTGEDGKDEILLQKRSGQKEIYPGCWDISSAGHLQAGDTFEQAAVRELAEELGVSAAEEELEVIGWNRDRTEVIANGRRFMDDELAKVYGLRRDMSESMFELQQEEVEAIQWMPLDEVWKKQQENNWKHCLREDELEMLRKYLEKQKRKEPAE